MAARPAENNITFDVCSNMILSANSFIDVEYTGKALKFLSIYPETDIMGDMINLYLYLISSPYVMTAPSNNV